MRQWAALDILYWVSERSHTVCAALPGTQRAPERDAAPANSQPALSERDKLRDLTEGTVGLLYREKAKLSVIKLPRHILVQQTSN